MSQQVEQIVQAIVVASDPAQAALHQQALQFLQNIESDAASAWKLGIDLFVEANPNGTRKYPAQARFFGLRLLERFLDDRFEPLDSDTFQAIQKALVGYIQSEYLVGQAEGSASYLRNKFSHILTLFFLSTYLEQWPTFFTDLFSLIRSQQAQSTSSASEFNPHVSLLLFHVLLEISGEVADQMLKSARTFTNVRHVRDAKVRDAVREKDAALINEAVITIVAGSVDKIKQVRWGESPASADQFREVVDWGVRSYGSYVGWVDINLTVTPTTIQLLFSLLSDDALAIRLATCGALQRLVSKGLKEPSDKLQLFKVLSLGQVLERLEERTRLEQQARGEDSDEGEETYREALGRLLNVLGVELARLVEETAENPDVQAEAVRQLKELRTTTLRFLGDPYDDTCSTIFPLLSTILSNLKKMKRTSPQNITDETRVFLSNALSAILEKMKWDPGEDPDDMDDDDKQTFESFRKGDLRVHLDAISVIEPEMVTNTVQQRVMDTLAAFQSGKQIPWNDAELAVYFVYIFGDINKSGGKGRAAFCLAPPVSKESRKKTDYSEFTLTTHGELLYTLIKCGISSYPHNAVNMQFFETCSRYSDFFKIRKECIIPLLEAMVGPRGVHHPNSSSRSRVYYLFYKFIREDRNEISPEVAVTLLNGFRDNLQIQVEIPELESPEQDVLTEAVANPGMFDSQLYLFETTGLLISLQFKNPADCEALLRSIVQPLLQDLSDSLRLIKSPQDFIPILKVHHTIMALGNVAKGFPDFPTPLPQDYVMPPIAVFREITQAIIVSLEAINVFKIVREAVRFAFGRMVATTGTNVIDFIPTLMTHLLAHFEPSELADFLTFIALFMHRLSKDIFDVINQLIGPLHTRIMELLASPVTGTDDKVTHTETKKAYLSFLSNVMTNGLGVAFLSDENKAGLEPLLTYVLQAAEDVGDPPNQRLAFAFLSKCVEQWSRITPAPGINIVGAAPSNPILPGFERYTYERVVPLIFQIPSSPSFNIKDGQMLVVLHEMSSFLKSVASARGTEFREFLVTVFFPSLNWPADTVADFTKALFEFEQKNFRKYFVDFVRASKQGTS